MSYISKIICDKCGEQVNCGTEEWIELSETSSMNTPIRRTPVMLHFCDFTCCRDFVKSEKASTLEAYRQQESI
jgi:hypothetical protein